LAWRTKIARICALFGAYTGERTWKAVGDRLQGPYYPSRDDHDRKIRARKQRTDFGKYCFVNRIINLWNQLPAKTLRTFPCKSHIVRNKDGKVIMRKSEGFFEAWWRNVQKWTEMKNGKWSVAKWSEVKNFGELCVLSLLLLLYIYLFIYNYVAVCMFCAVRYVIITCISLLFSNYFTNIFLIFFYVCFLVLYICFLFCVFCVFCIVLCIVSHFVCGCLFPIFVQVYWPLPSYINTDAVNKYRIISKP